MLSLSLSLWLWLPLSLVRAIAIVLSEYLIVMSHPAFVLLARRVYVMRQIVHMREKQTTPSPLLLRGISNWCTRRLYVYIYSNLPVLLAVTKE